MWKYSEKSGKSDMRESHLKAIALRKTHNKTLPKNEEEIIWDF